MILAELLGSDPIFVQDISGVLKGTGEFANTVTATELRYLQSNWEKFKDTIKIYRGGAEVSPPWVGQ